MDGVDVVNFAGSAECVGVNFGEAEIFDLALTVTWLGIACT